MPHDNANDAVNIRAAVSDDLEAIGRLASLLVQTHHDFDPARFIAAGPQTPRGYASFLGTQLEKKDIVVFVAELDGGVVGYTYAGAEGFDYMSLRGPAGVLHDLLVSPDHRRHGIGSKLLEATIAELWDRGVPRIVLSTAERNEAAQRLFAKSGFRRTMVEMTRERA